MERLIQLCVRRSGAISVLSLLALLLGTWGALKTPLDVFPEFAPSQVEIQTEAPGFAPQQVEELVTKPVENAVNGAAGLATLRSESIPGLSIVIVTFKDGVDLHVVRQGIAERLGEIGSSLPLGVGVPKLSPLVSSTMDLLKVGLVSDTADAYTLRDAADWSVKPRLLAVPGVARVTVFGGAVRQLQVRPDTTRLAQYGLTLSDVADAARGALALRGAGFVDLQAQRVLIKTPTPKPDATVLADAVVTTRGAVPIRLRDLGDVVEAPALQFGDAVIMGRPGILLSLASQYGANTLETTRAVESALRDLEPALQNQGIHLVGGLHRPANFIERALADLQNSLVIAALLILAVLYAFLRDWRSALIAFTAIPLSLLAAVLVLAHEGQTLNTMTLGGFAVALGVLVDDAIIGIENILRRLRLNARDPAPRPRLAVIAEAAVEVRGPVIYATAVVIAVFLPELYTSSVQGHFVGPLALSFILAVVASLAVAMTTTPALCALFLTADQHHGDARWLTTLKRWQAQAIGAACERIGTLGTGLGVLVLAALAGLPFLGGSFMPDFKEGHFVVQTTSTVTGTSLEVMRDAGIRISKSLLALPYVQSVEQQIGRAELSEDTWGPHRSEFHVELKPRATVDESVAEDAIRQIALQVPGLQSEVVTFLGDRISESLSGETAQVAIKVYGNDLEALDRTGDAISASLTHVTGITDLKFARQSGTPELSIELLPAAMAANGLKAQTVLDAVQTAYAGDIVGQAFEGIRTVDAVVILNPAQRHNLLSLEQLPITGPYGPVPLAQVARVRLAEDRYSIEHDGGQRRVSVTFNTQGRALQDVVTDARRTIEKTVKLPPGVYLEFTGAAEAEQQTRTELLLYSALSLALIVMILTIAFRWRRNAALVLVNLPFSLIGSVGAIAATGIGLSLGAVVGLVTVFGVSARNSILQLAHYEHLVDTEGTPWDRDTLIRGANERLVPILMTAAVTALGLAPLAVGLHEPGQEIEGPMAITVLGGLLSSTLLNLVLLPALSYRFSRTPASGAKRP